MNKLNKNNSHSLPLAMIMLLLLVAVVASMPSNATAVCLEVCDNDVVWEEHRLLPGMDSTNLSDPIPDFCICNEFICQGGEVHFSDYSVGVIRTWEWDFGDPASGANNYASYENPIHRYDSPGTYTVTLTITGYGSGSPISIVKQNIITVESLPIADFIVTPDSGCTGTVFQFEDRSIGATSWEWSFGDGSPDSYEQNPTHVYSAPGVYTVRLWAKNECGWQKILRDVIVTVGEQPTAAFEYEASQYCEGSTVSFYDRSINADTWHWDFGDGATSTDQNPVHSYAAAGNYDVTLSVTNDCGSDDTTETIEVSLAGPPVANFSSDAVPSCEGGVVTFTDLSIDAYSWRWEFGDGDNSFDQHPTHTYSLAGTYTVSLLVTNECGDDKIEKDIVITVLEKPTANFSSTLDGNCVGATATFVNLSTNANAYLWDFGDGTTSTDENPIHVYNTSGVFTVSLTAINDCGDDVETKEEYIIIGDGPIADFEATGQVYCVALPVSFTDLSSYAQTWLWDFGDGSSSSDQNPTHQYTVAGTYDVTLTASNGCGDDPETKRAYIEVHPKPIADYHWDKPEACVEENIQFTDNSQYVDTRTWYFGDGSTSHEENPIHSYSDTGTYLVWLEVSNDCGTDSYPFEQYIRIYGGPIAGFRAYQTDVCEGEVVSFENSSIDVTTGWTWYFGDGSSSTDEHPTHRYTTPGLYTVELHVGNSCGTDYTVRTDYINVSPQPNADFTLYDDLKCVNRPILFGNRSTNAESYLWYFGDGNTSTDEHPSHTYANPGTYTISLVAINDCGRDSTYHRDAFRVESGPTAAFVADDPNSCVSEIVTFINNSTDGDDFYWDFGDGITDNNYGGNTGHAYQTTGVYTVTLIAINECGVDTLIREAYVTVGEGPEADFTKDASHICVNETVNFTDRSTGAVSWRWHFGDGATSTDRNPSHTYTNPGLYLVSLTVTNPCGTDFTNFGSFVTVRDKPTVDFTYGKDVSSCFSTIIDFENLSDDATSYIWDFGDGSPTSTVENPSHSYSTTGNYDVKLIGSNSCGVDSIIKQVSISLPKDPVAAFTADETEVCTGENVQFTNQSTDAHFYRWNFGDGTSSIERNPRHAYTTPGTYTVSLRAESYCNKSDTETKELYITVGEYPLAEHMADKYEICVGGNVNFTDQSLRADSWLWEFGDGDTSPARHPSHTYVKAGIYHVYLTATNECGSDRTYEPLTIIVKPAPTADYSYKLNSECGPATLSFTNISNVGDSWLWDFDDGTTSTDENPVHGYASEGNYNVKLTVTNSCGSDDITKVIPINFIPLPVAGFTSDQTNICEGGSIQFTDQSTDALTYTWHFGDGTGSISQNPHHTYTQAGTYTVTLDIVGACGTDYTSKEEYITVEPGPIADFYAMPTKGCADLTVSFTDLSVRADSWLWDFGDGSATVTTQHSTHTYAAPGTYTVTLTATNDCGSDDEEKVKYITVYGDPIADFDYEQDSDCESGTVYFLDHSIGATSWTWDFGDGNSSTDQNPTHLYTAVGTYTVILTATNDCGDDADSQVIEIENSPGPIADFGVEVDEICVGGTVWFMDQSIRADTWLWDFGDGDTSHVQYPNHVYNITGVYTVSLTVTNECGDDTETKEQYITVLPGPIADFYAMPTEGCADLAVGFTDLSARADSWLWDFGDGSATVTTQNPTHTYAASGHYTVTLTVSNDCGSDDEEKIKYITVYGDPVAYFDYEQDGYCESGTVYFQDQSIDATSWTWDFGDGGTSSLQHPEHDYTTSGIYTVTLTATNSCGDDETTETVVIILSPGPIADFGTEVQEYCAGETVWFDDQSIRANTWLWDFGDGNKSQDQYPNNIYDTAGIYTVSLKVTNDCGDDTETKLNYVTVFGGPTAAFDATPTSGPPTLNVVFTDNSTSDKGIFAWTWDFGDGSNSNIQNPATHDYPNPGTYTVSLIVVDACGEDTTFETVTVIDDCTLDFITEPTAGCAPLTVDFSGQETGVCNISSWKWDFGDPTSGNDNSAATKDAQHIYVNPGTYTVILTAEDITGTLSVTKTDIVTVYGGPTAAFTASPDYGPAPLTVSFFDQSSSPNTITNWEWNFGDPASGSGNSSTAKDMVHYFASNGTYIVTLTVIDKCGSSSTTETIVVESALELIKEVDKPMATPGEELLYTLTLRNTGSETLNGIIVTDTIPDLSSYISGSLTGVGAYQSNEDLVEWPRISLGPNSKEIFTFKVLLDGPFQQFPALVTNYAIASFGTSTMAKLSPKTFVSNVVVTQVDIPLGPPIIDKEVSKSLASPGDTLTYTITVTNNEPAAAAGLKVYDAAPDYTTFLGNITGGGVYDPATDSLFWDLGTLAMFSDTSVSFDVTVNSDAPSGLMIPNSAAFDTDYLGGDQSDTVITNIHLDPIIITKTASRPSGMIGDLVRFTIKIENFSNEVFNNLVVLDTLPAGITYVDGTSLLEDTSIVDPTGSNPISWALGDLPGNSTVTLVYTSLISPSAVPGVHENIARATAIQNGNMTYSNRAVAPIYILSYTISGSIRGIVIVDCDGDGVADIDTVPSGMDIYLDDGSHSKVNEKGMFYFSTVRPGERVVALDKRDLDNFFVPEGAQASVFVHVQESGESYVIFRICPDYPKLNILKKASIIPKIKIIKKASINPDPITDSLGVVIDYTIDIKSNGLADTTHIRIVDSFPEDMNVILSEGEELVPKQTGNQLVYEITAAEEQLQKSIYYSLKDLAPGLRRFLTNKVHLESDPTMSSRAAGPIVSEPAEVSAGPFILAPPQDVTITLTPALFITSKAFLQEQAFPLLREVADSISKYPDASIWVEGHTDLRIINTPEFPSNWELGEARAKAVVDWLIDSANIDGNRMTYVSFAATKPVASDVPLSSVALQPNRRTEVIIKAGVLGFLAPEADPAKEWESSTSMALNPNRFDTLFEAVETQVAIDLDDSWEVILNIINESSIGATVTSLTDILPDGTEYVAGTATLDGVVITATNTGNVISFELTQIQPEQSLELRYRIRALDGQQPSGGGAALVEIKTASELPVVQSSNTVKFE